MGAPPGQQNRTPLFVALGVLGVAAFVFLIVLLSGGDDDKDPTTSPSTSESQPDDDPDITLPDIPTTDDDDDTGGEEPAGAGLVKSVDSGFVEYNDELYDDTYTAWGVIVENTSDQVARNVDVSIGFLDASGTVLDTDSAYITVLMPGQKFGIGGNQIEATGVTELSVQVSDPSEWDDPADFGDLTIEGLNVTFDSDYNAPQASFTVKSSYGEQVDSPNLYAIYRDASGKIVGGDYGYMDFIPPGGAAVGEVSSYASLPNVDGTKTEVYVDPNIY